MAKRLRNSSSEVGQNSDYSVEQESFYLVILRKEVSQSFFPVLKVMKSQNEYIRSSHCQKTNKILERFLP